MVGDPEARPHRRRRQADGVDELGDVAGEPGDIGGALGIAAVARKQVAVVFHHRAAARGGHDDGVERLLADDGGPGVDVAAGVAARFLFLAEMVDERAAAGLVLDHDDVDAVAPEQPDGGAADRGLKHFLHAAEHQRDALRFRVRADLRARPRELGLGQARRHERERGRRTARGRGGREARGTAGQASRASARAGSGADWAAPWPGGSASPAVAASDGPLPRCASGQDRRDAYSRRRSGRWSCRRSRRGSGRCGSVIDAVTWRSSNICFIR